MYFFSLIWFSAVWANSMKETREFLFYCGMFHDAGKLYFLDTINLFARALFNEEFDLIRLHPQMAMSSSANGIPQNQTPRRRSTTISGTTKKAAIRASIPIKATTTPFSTRSSPAPIVSMRQPIPSGGWSPWNANSYTAKSSVKTWSWFYNFGFCLWY